MSLIQILWYSHLAASFPARPIRWQCSLFLHAAPEDEGRECGASGWGLQAALGRAGGTEAPKAWERHWKSVLPFSAHRPRPAGDGGTCSALARLLELLLKNRASKELVWPSAGMPGCGGDFPGRITHGPDGASPLEVPCAAVEEMPGCGAGAERWVCGALNWSWKAALGLYKLSIPCLLCSMETLSGDQSTPRSESPTERRLAAARPKRVKSG